MNAHHEHYERTQFINTRGEIEIGLLRVTPPIPGKPASELPREVCISSAAQPKGKS